MTTSSRANEHGLGEPASGSARTRSAMDDTAGRTNTAGSAGIGSAGDAETAAAPETLIDELIEQTRQDPPVRSRASERASRDAAPPRRREPKRWKPRRQVASLALTFAMFGLSMSWFMPWATPASLVAVVLAGIAVGHSWEDRATAGWALGLGIAGTLGGVFWAVWIWHALAAMPA